MRPRQPYPIAELYHPAVVFTSTGFATPNDVVLLCASDPCEPLRTKLRTPLSWPFSPAAPSKSAYALHYAQTEPLRCRSNSLSASAPTLTGCTNIGSIRHQPLEPTGPHERDQSLARPKRSRRMRVSLLTCYIWPLGTPSSAGHCNRRHSLSISAKLQPQHPSMPDRNPSSRRLPRSFGSAARRIRPLHGQRVTALGPPDSSLLN